MKVRRHAEDALVALGPIMPMPASVVLDRLRRTDPPTRSTALEVCRMTMSHGDQSEDLHQRSSNGDSVVVIIRDGIAVTAMLRRTWNQPFDPAALRVDEVASWQWKWHAPDGHNRGQGEWAA